MVLFIAPPLLLVIMCGDNTMVNAAVCPHDARDVKNVIVPTYRTPSVSNVERKRNGLSTKHANTSVRRRALVCDSMTWTDCRLLFNCDIGKGGRFMLLLFIF